MKNKIIAAALIKSVIEHKTTHFTECAEKILAGADDSDTKIKKILQLYADTFGTMGNHIVRDLQSMYPDVWQGRQDFHRRTIHTVIELIKVGTNEKIYRNVNLSVVEEILMVLFETLGSAEFLNRTHCTINIAARRSGFFVAAMIDTGAGASCLCHNRFAKRGGNA